MATFVAFVSGAIRILDVASGAAFMVAIALVLIGLVSRASQKRIAGLLWLPARVIQVEMLLASGMEIWSVLGVWMLLVVCAIPLLRRNIVFVAAVFAVAARDPRTAVGLVATWLVLFSVDFVVARFGETSADRIARKFAKWRGSVATEKPPRRNVDVNALEREATLLLRARELEPDPGKREQFEDRLLVIKDMLKAAGHWE
jgi:hypothetical protein